MRRVGSGCTRSSASVDSPRTLLRSAVPRAYSYGTHTAVLTAATDSLEAGDIGTQDAQRVLRVADEARTALDAARVAAGAGDATTAEGRLQLATALLAELQTYLRAQR